MKCNWTDPGVGPNRYVGDPVDVVTGANVDVAEDFYLAGPVPLVWTRHYSSARAQEAGELGFGHRHVYERTLRYDLDGMLYRDETGRAVPFPFLTEDGAQVAREGLRLTRIDVRRYRLESRSGPAMEFAFADYERPGALVKVREGGSTFALERDSRGRLTAIVDPLGRRLLVERDREGRIAAITLAPSQRRLVRYHYDKAGDLVASEDERGFSLGYRYDAAHLMVKKTDRGGYAFLFEYDREGRCVHAAGEDGVVAVRLEYMPQGTTVSDASGGTWTYVHDANGNITQIIDPYGGKRVFEFDEQGRLAAETDAVGETLRIVHDEDGGVAGRVDARGRAVPDGGFLPETLRWASLPRGAREWDYGYFVTPSQVLPSEQEILGTVPAAVSSHLKVRSYGVPLPSVDWDRGESVDARGGRERRDSRGQRVEREWPDGSSERWKRDARGDVVAYTDRDGATTEYVYRSWSHCVAVRDPLGAESHYEITPAEKTGAITDAGGTRTEYGHDLKGRRVEVRRHGVMRETYEYDAIDRVVAKYDARNQPLLRLEYGAGSLIKTRTLVSGDVQKFEYDGQRRIVRAKSEAGEVELAYGRRGEVIEDLRDGRGVEVAYNGPMAELRVLGRFTVSWADGNSSWRAIRLPTGATLELYHPGHGLVLRRFGKTLEETTQYDPRGRCLIRIVRSRDASERMWSRRYDYSQQGNLVAVADSDVGLAWFTHDAAHRLQETQESGAQPSSYVYDRAGNLLRKPGLEGVGLREGNRLECANGAVFAYDPRNHVAAQRDPAGEARFRYDGLDQLVEVARAEGRWTATYDALGRRVAKSWWGGRREYFYRRHQLIAETDERGALRIYVYADDHSITPLAWVDYASLDAEPESGSVHHVVCNHLSAPLSVYDEEGRERWRASLDPYGEVRVELGAELFQPLRFPGHYCDDELGLHHNGARYYNPITGRYLQSDPIGLSGGLNLYAYTDNPLREVDVSGLCGTSNGHDDATEDPNNPKAPEGEEGHARPATDEEPSAFPNLDRGAGRTDEHAERAASTLELMSTPEGRRQLAEEIVRTRGFDEETARLVEERRRTAAEEFDAVPGNDPAERQAYIDTEVGAVQNRRTRQFNNAVAEEHRVLNRAPIESDRSVTVIEHSDGSATVGVSGADVRTSSNGEVVATDRPRVQDGRNLADTMNRRYPNDSYHAASGDSVNVPGVERRPGGNQENVCSEAHAAVGAGEHNSANDTSATGYQTVWAGSDPPPQYNRGNPPETTSPTGPTTMNPCNTCAGAGENNDQYGQVIGPQERNP